MRSPQIRPVTQRSRAPGAAMCDVDVSVVAQSRYGQLDPFGLWCRRGSSDTIQIPTPEKPKAIWLAWKHQKDKKTSNMCELFDKLEGASTDVVTARHSQRNA